jgi:hypothetical protein
MCLRGRDDECGETAEKMLMAKWWVTGSLKGLLRFTLRHEAKW